MNFVIYHLSFRIFVKSCFWIFENPNPSPEMNFPFWYSDVSHSISYSCVKRCIFVFFTILLEWIAKWIRFRFRFFPLELQKQHLIVLQGWLKYYTRKSFKWTLFKQYILYSNCIYYIILIYKAHNIFQYS